MKKQTPHVPWRLKIPLKLSRLFFEIVVKVITVIREGEVPHHCDTTKFLMRVAK
jgi:hypothetical protein